MKSRQFYAAMKEQAARIGWMLSSAGGGHPTKYLKFVRENPDLPGQPADVLWLRALPNEEWDAAQILSRLAQIPRGIGTVGTEYSPGAASWLSSDAMGHDVAEVAPGLYTSLREDHISHRGDDSRGLLTAARHRDLQKSEPDPVVVEPAAAVSPGLQESPAGGGSSFLLVGLVLAVLVVVLGGLS